MSAEVIFTDVDHTTDLLKETLAEASAAILAISDRKELQASETMTQNFIDATEQQIATRLKEYLDAKYSPNWHVIVGRNFVNYSSYMERSYMHFKFGQLSFLVFKCV